MRSTVNMATRRRLPLDLLFALTFGALSCVLISVAAGLVDISVLSYSRCRTCPRQLTPSGATVALLAAMFASMTVASLSERFSTRVPIKYSGTLSWLLLCVVLGNHAICSDDLVGVRMVTGMFAALFSLMSLLFALAVAMRAWGRFSDHRLTTHLRQGAPFSE